MKPAILLLFAILAGDVLFLEFMLRDEGIASVLWLTGTGRGVSFIGLISPLGAVSFLGFIWICQAVGFDP